MIRIDPSGRITAIDEKPDNPATPYASMGIYYFPRASIRLIREYLRSPEKKDAPGHYAAWLLGKMPLFARVFKGRWYDIGSFDQLEEAGRSYGRVRA